MKYRPCIVCIAAFILAMAATPLHAQDRLVLGFGGRTEDLGPVIYARILAEAYGRIGIEIEARGLPGPRSLAKVNRGEIDGELFRGDFFQELPLNLIRIPVPIGSEEVVVFTKDADFHVTGWDSLQPYKIGIISGIKEVEFGTKGMQVEPLPNPEQLIMKLATGRNDIVVLPRVLGMEVLKSLMTLNPEGIDLQTLQKIRVLEPPIHREDLYHYLHNTHAALVPKITAVLQEMSDEGTIRRITEEVEADFFNQ